MSLDYGHNLDDCYAQARAILKHHGKSYYFATRLFSPELQRATSAVYAFVRLPDEIVDNSPSETPEDLVLVKEKIEAWKDDWSKAYKNQGSPHPVLHIAAKTWHEYSIPYKYSEAFISAMIQDTHVTRYQTYADLKHYMYGSAAAVGLMMSHVIGFSDAIALKHARQLGYAMQLSNFLRDVEEDYVQRGRVYLPQDDMAEYGLSDDDIARKNFSPAFKLFMQFQMQRAHQLYEEANTGIAYLKPEGRFAVMAASTLYRGILTKLAKQNSNPFAGRASTNKIEKILLANQARLAVKKMQSDA